MTDTLSLAETIAKQQLKLNMYREQITNQNRALARYKRNIKLMESAYRALMIERDNLLTARIGTGGL